MNGLEQLLLPHSFCVPGIQAQLNWVFWLKVSLKTVTNVLAGAGFISRREPQ